MPKRTAMKRRAKAERATNRAPAFQESLAQTDGLALIAMAERKLDRAIADARQAVGSDPENAHALANLVVCLLRLGRAEEAGEIGRRLEALTPTRDDGWVKIAEGLSYLGDDEGVIATYERARRSKALEDPVSGPALEHLTAVAMARLGRVGEARHHWGRVPKSSPYLALAEQNLADLKAPVEQRHGPWAFPIQSWLSPGLAAEVAALIEGLARDGDATMDDPLRRFLGRHPDLVHVVPHLLDRGDPAARVFALHLAAAARSPVLLAALRDFALGRRGTDADRLRALGALEDAKVLGPGAVRMWQEGEWREIVPLTFEITDEPVHRPPPPLRELVAEEVGLLRQGRAREALPVLQRALELAPDDPSLLNNLASAYTVLGRADEAEALVRRIARDHPDYFFGQIGLAQLEARARRTEAAHRILEGLQGRPRYHRSEFVALCLAEVEVLLAEKNPAGARSWLDLLASVDPEHPSIPRLREIIKRAR